MGHAGQCGEMPAAGATWFADLRAETTPPRHPVPVEYFALEDLTDGQGAVTLEAVRRVRALTDAGECVGIYCQAGPQAMPAVELLRSLESATERRSPEQDA
ncbi:MAG: hypothetical protein GEV07_28925 [Streptosporangiales bacterium]|nr:hypothetical protein [Streptosporangiales bacterium]